MTDEQTKTESRPSGIGPGERLQAARIQKGLSIEDVASRMHLSVSILEAIEVNNFEEITAPIFVKGYLRAYARIVSLDEDDMIQQYMDYYSEEDPPISSTSNMAPELSVADMRIKWTTYLVVVVLAALLAAWWWNKGQNEEAPISLDAQTSSPEQTELTDSELVSTEIEAASQALGETVEAIRAETQPAETEVNGEVETATVDTAEAAPTEPEPDESAEAAPTEPEPAESVETVAMQQPEPDATSTEETATVEEESEPGSRGLPQLIAPSGSDKLRVIVNADTWADIKDSSDYQLVYDLLRADQVVEMTGEAPFTVFLGNGHGVEILFNEEEIDFSFRIRDDNTARLKIGG